VPRDPRGWRRTAAHRCAPVEIAVEMAHPLAASDRGPSDGHRQAM